MEWEMALLEWHQCKKQDPNYYLIPKSDYLGCWLRRYVPKLALNRYHHRQERAGLPDPVKLRLQRQYCYCLSPQQRR